MRFRLATTGAGAPSLESGVGNLFNSIAMAPLYEAQAAEQAQLTGLKQQLAQSQIGHHVAKAALEEEERKALAGRGDVLDLMGATRAGTSVPLFRAAIAERTGGAPDMGPPIIGGAVDAPRLDDAITTLYGPAMATPAKSTNWDQIANARGRYQTQDVLDQVLSGRTEPARAGAAVAASKGSKMVENIGNTGAGFNVFSGKGVTLDPGLRTLFGEEGAALVQQRKAAAGASGAAAGLSNARRERVTGGYDKPVTVLDDETGDATITRLPTGGEPVSVGAAPKKNTGTDATNAKERNRVVREVEKELGRDAPEAEVQAEVDKRMARRGGSAKPPAASAQQAAPTNPKDRRAGTVYVTPKGPMKWTGTGWLPAN